MENKRVFVATIRDFKKLFEGEPERIQEIAPRKGKLGLEDFL